MSRVISNLLLSLSLIPLAVAVFLMTAISLGEGTQMRGATASSVASFVMLLFVVVYWTCVWATSVKWTESRILRTVAAGLGALLAGLVVGVFLLVSMGPYGDSEAGIIFGSMVAATGWMVFSSLAWRETGAEHTARLQKTAGDGATFASVLLCPNCEYNMTGLTQARCPECGSEYTLDSLLAANIERVEPERELGGKSA